MSKEEIKKESCDLIDEIEDEKTSSDTGDEELTDAQWASIKKGLQQIENGETYTHEQVMQRLKEWRNTKSNSQNSQSKDYPGPHQK